MELKLERVVVTAPGWGRVFVREMSSRERREFLAKTSDPAGGVEDWLVYTLCEHEDGSRVFSSVDEVSNASWRAVDVVARAALNVSGMISGSVEAAEKN